MSAKSKRLEHASSARTSQSDQVQETPRQDGNSVAQEIAAQAFEGSTGQLPHLAAIESAFGGRSLGGIQVAMGGQASAANEQLGSSGFALGGRMALGGGADLHTAAHEAAHLFQSGAGSSRAGDANENQANAIADRVVAGESAADLMTGLAMAPRSSGGLQLDTGTPDIDAVGSDVDAAEDAVSGAKTDVEDGIETGEEVAETAQTAWNIALPYLKGERTFREEETVWAQEGPVSIAPDVTDRKTMPDLLPGVPLIGFHPFREYGIKNISAHGIRVESTDPKTADFQATIKASATASVGFDLKAGPEIPLGKKFTAFAGVEGSASAEIDAGTIEIPIHKTQTDGKWSGDGFKVELSAIHAALHGQLKAGAFVKWTTRKGVERQLGKMHPWPEDSVICEGELSGLTIDNTGEKFQVLVGQDPLMDRVSALGERIGTWFEERPRILHRKAEEDVAVEASGSDESEQDIEEV